MAESKKKKSTTSKKTAAKNTPAKKQAEPKQSEPKTAESKPAEAKKTKRDPSGKSTSVLLFAAGVLLTLMFFVSGSSGWKVMHEILHGLFGIAAVMIPATLLYSAIMIGKDKSNEKTTLRVVCGLLLTFLASGALQIFTVGALPEGTKLEVASQLYLEGKSLKGGGAASWLIAYPLLKYMGKAGARILMAVAVFVLVMFVTGSSMNDFFGILGKPFKWMKQGAKGLDNLLMGGEFGE